MCFLALPPLEPMQKQDTEGNESVSFTADNKLVILELVCSTPYPNLGSLLSYIGAGQ